MENQKVTNHKLGYEQEDCQACFQSTRLDTDRKESKSTFYVVDFIGSIKQFTSPVGSVGVYL